MGIADVVIAYKPLIIEFFDIIALIGGSAFVALGVVYVFGRMLDIIKTDKAKNILAIILIYGIHYSYLYLPFTSRTYGTILEQIWYCFLFGSISIVIYVSFCWRFYSRIDSFQDKKIGEDHFKPSIRKKKIKK